MYDMRRMEIIESIQKICRNPLHVRHLQCSIHLSLDILQQTHPQRVIDKAMMIPIRNFDCKRIPRPPHAISAIMRGARISQVL